MTLYILRHPHAATPARDKDQAFLLLYQDSLLTATDAGRLSRTEIAALANFINTGLVDLFNPWLATRDLLQMTTTLENLIRAAQMLATNGLLICTES